MTHEDLLSMGFVYAPVMFKTLPPYIKGQGGFNRYEHPNMNMVMQHYVDDDRFVAQRIGASEPRFNGRCADRKELQKAITTGSVMYEGDTVCIVENGRCGFILPSFYMGRWMCFGHTHLVMNHKKFAVGFGFETGIIPCRMVLIEKSYPESKDEEHKEQIINMFENQCTGRA